MTEKIIVGIDFGTSTSVVRVKSYSVENNNGSEIWKSFDRNEMMAYNVTFNSGQVIVPTIIQKVNNVNADNVSYFGYDAAVHKKGEILYQNFKVELEGPQSESARELTQEYLRYLCETYRTQREGGYLGSPSAEEKTIISYPVKWSEETRNFMLEAAKKAGFKNVEGMDEAEAAITAVTAISSDMLKQKKYIERDTPVNIMLIDMGAGTTDIVICRYTPGEKPKNDILCTWPKEGEILFGGRELDELLRRYILDKTPEDGKSLIQRKISVNEYKAWKENTVSGCLQRRESVTYFSHATSILDVLDMDLDDFSLDRAVFEEYARDYLDQFPKLVNGSVQACIDSGKLGSSSDIDLVILTGGHSCWYFVKDMLLGEGDQICLEKIKADNNRLISIAKPQETVALGLVYSKLPQFSAVKGSARPGQGTNQNQKRNTNPGTNRPKPEHSERRTHDEPKTRDNGFCRRCGAHFESLEQPFCPSCGLKRRLVCKEPLVVSSCPRWQEKNQFFKIAEDAFNSMFSSVGTNNLAVFTRTLCIPNNSKIYCINDTSWFKRGKNGFALCSDGIYIRPAFEVKARQMSWASVLLYIDDITYVEYSKTFHFLLRHNLKKTDFYKRLVKEIISQDDDILMNDPVHIDELHLNNDINALMSYYFDPLEEIQKKHKRCRKGDNNYLRIDLSAITKDLTDDFEKQVRTFADEWLDVAYSDYTSLPKNRKNEAMTIIAEKFHTYIDDKLFFVRYKYIQGTSVYNNDDTLPLTARIDNGIVLCTSGIYYFAEGNANYTPWNKFLLMDLKKILDDTISIDCCIIAQASGTSNIPKLFALLQTQLRKTEYYEYLKEQAADPANQLTESTITDKEMQSYYFLGGNLFNVQCVEEQAKEHIFGLNDLNQEIKDIYFGSNDSDNS